MSLKIFSLSLFSCLTAYGESESLVSEEVYQRINEGIIDYGRMHLTSEMPAAQALRDKVFAGLDDREKIRALAEWIFRKPPPHHYGIAWHAASLLRAPEPVINDYSELHRLMALETDSRRFYQLFGLAAYGERNGDNFMAVRARGLFMEGVAADHGQSSISHPLNSISMFCFSYITEELRDKSQAFRDEVYPELVKRDLEARNLALAKWLKANWPGCENLEIPDKGENEKDPRDNASMDSRLRLGKPPATDPPPKVAENYALRYILGGVGTLVALLGAWFGLRRLKSI